MIFKNNDCGVDKEILSPIKTGYDWRFFGRIRQSNIMKCHAIYKLYHMSKSPIIQDEHIFYSSLN